MGSSGNRPRRDDQIPEGGAATIIRRIKGRSARRYTILSGKVYGYWAHWNGYYTSACTDESGETCEGHKRKWPLKWRGYLHVRDWLTGELVHLELPGGAARQIKSQTIQGQDLRGLVLEVFRTSEAKHSHCRVMVHLGTIPADDLPADKDPTDDVGKLWGHIPRKGGAPD